MTKADADNVRARDDRHLRRLVSAEREAMKAEGIDDRPLDWEAVAREEQAVWWRERVRQALADLVAAGRDIGDAVAARASQIAASLGAEAALEVSVDADHRTGRVAAEPARACVRDAAGLEFTYAAAALRSKMGVAADGEESVGIFISSSIPGARVIADAAHGSVIVEIWKPASPFVVVLVPEDPSLQSRAADLTPADDTGRVVFEDLQPGRYLLAVYSQT